MPTDAEPEVLQQTDVRIRKRENRSYLQQHIFFVCYRNNSRVWFHDTFNDRLMPRRENKEYRHQHFFFNSFKSVLSPWWLRAVDAKRPKTQIELWQDYGYYIYPSVFFQSPKSIKTFPSHSAIFPTVYNNYSVNHQRMATTSWRNILNGFQKVDIAGTVNWACITISEGDNWTCP